MGIHDELLIHTAVYWAPGVPGRYGDRPTPTPVQIACRWYDTKEQIIGENGDTLTVRAKVFVDRVLGVEGRLERGDISDPPPAAPADTAPVIKKAKAVDNHPGDATLHVVWVS